MGIAIGVDELEIQHALLELMKDGKIWSNSDLKTKLRTALQWSSKDLERAPNRPNEYRWENRVNNALSPARGSSLYAKGQVENAGHGLHHITLRGLRFIKTEDFDVDDLIAGLDRS